MRSAWSALDSKSDLSMHLDTVSEASHLPALLVGQVGCRQGRRGCTQAGCGREAPPRRPRPTAFPTWRSLTSRHHRRPSRGSTLPGTPRCLWAAAACAALWTAPSPPLPPPAPAHKPCPQHHKKIKYWYAPQELHPPLCYYVLGCWRSTAFPLGPTARAMHMHAQGPL